MACYRIGTNPLAEPILAYYQLDHREQISVISRFTLFIEEKEFESAICEMAAILSQRKCVKQMPMIILFGTGSHISSGLLSNVHDEVHYFLILIKPSSATCRLQHIGADTNWPTFLDDTFKYI